MRTHSPLSALAHACYLLLVMMATACIAQGGEPTEAPSMDTVFAKVLEPRCTFSSCHSAPTVAAKLDLSRERACNALVGATSCLFPDRKLVVASDPDDSFLMHKLTGTGLSDVPSTSCAGESNAPMPYGGSTIPEHEIDLIRSWISAGAPCEPTGLIDPGAAPGPAAPAIASLTVSQAMPAAGQVITFTVALDRPAPAGGQVIALQTATRALSAPVQVYVPAGETAVSFDAYAERPTSLFTLSARSGTSTKTLQLRVTGLEVAEALGDSGHGDHSQWIKLRNRASVPIELSSYRLQVGQTSYGLITVPLTGTVPVGGCAVIGQFESLIVGGSVIYQYVDFNPDVPTTGTQATGFAVFDSTAGTVGGIRAPLDTVLVGATNDAQLVNTDGQPAAPGCATPPAGSSARRTGTAACTWSAPEPTQCQ